MMHRPVIAGFVCFTVLGQIPQMPTFQTQANLVIVNVTVRDQSGKLIENLKKEDFALFEDDRPQNISVFEVEHLSSNALPPVAQQPQIITALSNAPRPTAPASESAVSRRDRRLLALYFDFSSMQPQEQIRAQQAALKFLNQQMTASDLVGILTYTN